MFRGLISLGSSGSFLLLWRLALVWPGMRSWALKAHCQHSPDEYYTWRGPRVWGSLKAVSFPAPAAEVTSQREAEHVARLWLFIFINEMCLI